MPLAPVAERRGSTASQFLLVAIVGCAGLLLCVSMIPAHALPRGALGHAVTHHRFELAMFGLATLGAMGIGYLVSLTS